MNTAPDQTRCKALLGPWGYDDDLHGYKNLHVIQKTKCMKSKIPGVYTLLLASNCFSTGVKMLQLL